MRRAKPTPGPWATEISDYGSPRIGTVFAKFDIARICNKPGAALNPETDANARLIAAAPELLEALLQAESLIDTLQLQCLDRVDCSRDSRLTAITAAIAKATGAETSQAAAVRGTR